MYLLGVFGPYQVIFIGILGLGLLVVLPIAIIASRAKHKARANTLEEMMNRQPSKDDQMEKLDRLNKLRLSGALTEEEFAEQKKALLR